MNIYKNNIETFLNINKHIDGNYIELGTFKGKGTVILGNFIKNNNLYKKVITFDTFNGYTAADIQKANKKQQPGLIKNQKSNRWDINEQIVIDKLRNNNIHNIVEIKKGDINNTIKDINNQLISLIYIDCNAYNPAFNALIHLNKQINHCCFIIIDEHTIGGETQALREFVEKYNIKGTLFKLKTTHLTGPRLIFNVNKSTNDTMYLQWASINYMLTRKYDKVLKFEKENPQDKLQLFRKSNNPFGMKLF